MLKHILYKKPTYSEIGYTEREYIQNMYDSLDKVYELVNCKGYGKNSIETDNIELTNLQFWYSLDDIIKRRGKPIFIIDKSFSRTNHQILYYKYLVNNIKKKYLLHLLNNKLFCIEVEYCEINNIMWKDIKTDIINSIVKLNQDITNIDLIKSKSNDLIIFNERPPYTTKILSGLPYFKETIDKRYTKQFEMGKEPKSIYKKCLNIFR